jgi:hypothetical protein
VKDPDSYHTALEGKCGHSGQAAYNESRPKSVSIARFDTYLDSELWAGNNKHLVWVAESSTKVRSCKLS